MKPRETKPLKPFVTLEQIEAFDPERPETFTDSRIMNEVCYAFKMLGTYVMAEDIAAYLEVEKRHLSGAVQLITGYSLGDLRVELCHRKMLALHEQHPSWNPDEIARAAGYHDRTALYRAVGKKNYDKLFAKYVWS